MLTLPDEGPITAVLVSRSMVTELSGISDTILPSKCRVYEETEIPVRDVDVRLAKEIFSRRPETEYRLISKRPVHIIAEKEKSSKKGFKITGLGTY